MSDVTPVHVGQIVPHFELETYNPAEGDFGKFSLAATQKSGRWTILVFYPADFTFVCPTELADLAAKHSALAALGAEVVGISTDTKFAHLAWRQSERLLADVQYTLAADPTGKVSRLFGVYDENSGLALRGTFIINPAGLLVASEVNFYNVGRNADELLRKTEASVYLADHPAEACPAKWVPGGRTLTPGKDMVGKVFEALQEPAPKAAPAKKAPAKKK
jgi:peroxiredoxin (alkyl hydroperoxide reductase subunit C)